MTICARCRCETNVTTMSFFNTSIICSDFSDKERKHPAYAAAHDAECAAVRQGNYNFPGVGKPGDL